jgi:hypothetical protein
MPQASTRTSTSPGRGNGSGHSFHHQRLADLSKNHRSHCCTPVPISRADDVDV